VPLFFVSKLASQHVKVVLTGEGSDELLAGYGRYPRALLNWHAGSTYERVAPAPVRARVAQMVPHVPGRLGSYLSRSFLAVDRAPDLVFFDTFAAIPIAKQRALLAHDGIRSLARDEVYGPSLQHFDSLSEGGVLDRLLYADLKTYLVELLMKQDQMSMAASIESRVPFLDHHLVEFAARLPADRKLVRFNTKRILRAAVKDVLPPQILDRSKMGFPVPFAAWLGQGWSGVVRDVLLDRRARERGIFDSPAVERLLEPGAASTHAAALWSLFNLELWYRTFIDGDGIQTLPSFSRALAPPLGTNSAVEPVAAESRH
jgi:asparagine synthase (glutamine-hydrolysing)